MSGTGGLLDRTVGEWVAEQPSRSKVFEKVGIDYCCKGNVALGAACEAKGIAVGPVLEALAFRASEPEADDFSIASRFHSVGAMVDFIVGTHHAYLRENLPRLSFLTGKVAAVHGSEDARLGQLHAAFEVFKSETDAHMDKEEAILFPFIKMLGNGQRPPFPPTVTMPIRHMMTEHEDHGRNLELFRHLTDEFVPPSFACNTYLAMLQGLEEMERDLHRHIHLENTVLFPWAARLEVELGGTPEAFSKLNCH